LGQNVVQNIYLLLAKTKQKKRREEKTKIEAKRECTWKCVTHFTKLQKENQQKAKKVLVHAGVCSVSMCVCVCVCLCVWELWQHT